MKTLTLTLATALTLFAGTGCLATGEEPSSDENLTTETQAVTGGCTLLRPFGWSGVGVSCMENRAINTPYPLAYGETYYADAAPWGVLGEGYAIVQCGANGQLTVIEKRCRKASGDPL